MATAARVAAALLVVTAALFVVGVVTEPDGHAESVEATGEHDEAAEAGHASEETVLGVDVESPGPIVAAVAVPALLAVALWSRPLRLVALAALVVGIAFVVFDVAEVAHQLDVDRSGFALLAGLVAAGHAAAALMSGRVAWNRT